ncbi:MAG: phosphoribosylaminoimidazolesuccinocarboxamide synthase [Planctomycetota bacterium]
MFTFDDHGCLVRTDLQSALPSEFAGPVQRGKVRDVYDLGDRLMIVSTDRISAFDFILPTGIPGKGQLLTEMSEFWFEQLPVDHHWLGRDIPATIADKIDASPLIGRTMFTRKAKVIPFECVVRGYLEGSGLREYQSTGAICGNELPEGLRQCDQLPSPIFTPATKAEEGHDENVSFDYMADTIGPELARELRDKSLMIYQFARELAARRGIMIADTKFEFGLIEDRIILIDEVLTPDSSRFWAADVYQPGQAQPSFDKQFVREWLSQCGWDKQSDPPALPAEIAEQTAAKYREAYERLALMH